MIQVSRVQVFDKFLKNLETQSWSEGKTEE